jgi:type IV secretion system protein VirB4
MNDGDTGHMLVFGPTGAGKSTFNNLLAASFLKYKNAQVFLVDIGLSALTLTLAVGGEYINPGNSNIGFQPFEHLNENDKQEKIWATEFVETLIEMQGVKVTGPMSVAISAAIEIVATQPVERRTLTTFSLNCNYVDENNKNPIDMAIAPYLYGLDENHPGQYAHIFDKDPRKMNKISNSRWIMMEMETLMEMGAKVVAPAIMYIFHMLERRFTGELSLLALDEAWRFLDHPIFESKMKNWLKTLRKKNVFVCFLTQEVADAAKSKIVSTLIQNCPTKIYLADPQALDTAESYSAFGLSQEEIELLSMSKKKRDYYYKSAIGTRLFQLSLGKLQLALFKEQKRKMKDPIDGSIYVWGDYCNYLLSEKERTGYKGGLVFEILKQQGIEYEKYMEGVEYEQPGVDEEEEE